MSFKVPEEYRIKKGKMGSDKSYGNNGAFLIPCSAHTRKAVLQVIASDGEGWEHVSVSLHNAERTPVWGEMCFIKDLFWSNDDCVLQYHPPKANYVNQHPYTLHLWRPTDLIVPIPSDYLVGIRSLEDASETLYNMMGLMSPRQADEQKAVANNMMKHGGSFVKKLGDLIQRADPHNLQKLKQIFHEDWQEYKEWGAENKKESVDE